MSRDLLVDNVSKPNAVVPNFDVLNAQREKIFDAAQRHGAFNIRVFGSVARGDAQEASDMDFLVDFETGRSLFDLVHLVDELETILGVHVDVVTPEELRPRNRDQIMAESRPL